MKRIHVPWLNRLAAAGFAVAAACLAYAGFVHMFDNGLLGALVGACVGGFALGRMMRLGSPQRG
ncbi:MAG: hypothetical protein JJU18_00065 [Oceanicaulis sp.]|nr:hypothetical protein [Oceanicaulis sp.]